MKRRLADAAAVEVLVQLCRCPDSVSSWVIDNLVRRRNRSSQGYPSVGFGVTTPEYLSA